MSRVGVLVRLLPREESHDSFYPVDRNTSHESSPLMFYRNDMSFFPLWLGPGVISVLKDFLVLSPHSHDPSYAKGRLDPFIGEDILQQNFGGFVKKKGQIYIRYKKVSSMCFLQIRKETYGTPDPTPTPLTPSSTVLRSIILSIFECLAQPFPTLNRKSGLWHWLIISGTIVFRYFSKPKI